MRSRYARRASEAIPLPQFVGLLGDILDRQGNHVSSATAAGDRRRDRPAARRRTVSASTSSRPSTAPTTASGPLQTVALARRARAERPSIYGDDALGWALARAGRCDEAVSWSQRSLRLGTRDALLWFHRGYAAGCCGDAAGMRTWYAKALALNPHFSVRFAPIARKALS